MFAAQYCVTPTKRPIHRMHEKATTFLRDVKRRSLRVKRSKSLVINPPEKRKSGKKIKFFLISTIAQPSFNIFQLQKNGVFDSDSLN